MTPKELKALAKACREAGITTFEGVGVKFTLGPAPIKVRKRFKEAAEEVLSDFEKAVKEAQTPVKAASEPIKTDTPTENELLFWSVTDEEEASI